MNVCVYVRVCYSFYQGCQSVKHIFPLLQFLLLPRMPCAF